MLASTRTEPMMLVKFTVAVAVQVFVLQGNRQAIQARQSFCHAIDRRLNEVWSDVDIWNKTAVMRITEAIRSYWIVNR